MRRNARRITADGRQCPLAPDEHGWMFVLRSGRMYCPSRAHEPLDNRPATRSLWPVVGFVAAVESYTKEEAT